MERRKFTREFKPFWRRMNMETLAEQVIGAYLVQGGKVFISPGYNIDDGRTCPDFVALDFDKREVVVVEVTTAYKLNSLIEN